MHFQVLSRISHTFSLGHKNRERENGEIIGSIVNQSHVNYRLYQKIRQPSLAKNHLLLF